MRIREASLDDWPAIWPFFESICRAGETYTYPVDVTYEQGRELWFGEPGRVVVAEHGETVVGSAKMGPNKAGNGAHIGTASFMVDPAAAGRGVGRALAEDMMRWHREQGFRGICFNAVVETNQAAVHLWESLGFVVVGTVPEAFQHPVHGYVGLHVMLADLTG